MMEWKYILAEDGKTPIPEPDVLKWAYWFENSAEQRAVAYDQIGLIEVSTVFLGIDHNFSLRGDPILWETMIFGAAAGELEHYVERYSSFEDAVEGHQRALLLVQKNPR